MKPSHHRVILSLFLASGALGLGYQVLWSKYLLDFIGVSSHSYATVLAAFMGGLAIGSWILGKAADRIASPLRLYAYLEIGIGAYAIAFPGLMRKVAELYEAHLSFTPEEAATTPALWAKVVASGLLLLAPTILMGGTFPALVRHATRSVRDVGKRSSQLYAANALGAVLGIFCMAFWMMPSLGMRASLMALPLGNFVVALGAFLLAGATDRDAVSPGESVAAPCADLESGQPASPDRRVVRLALGLIFTEGMIAFGYEIAWTRYFGLVLGSSTYSFSIMLAAFISGIALGSSILSRIERRIPSAIRAFGWTQILTGLLVLLPLPLYPYVPWLFKQTLALLAPRPPAFFLYEAGKLLFCLAAMLPATILIGMSLPLVVKGLNRSLERLGRDTGRVYAWNTAGNVIGAVLAGFLFLPRLGMERLFHWSVVANGIVGLAAIACFPPPGEKRGFRLALLTRPIALFAAMVVLTAAAGPWDLAWFSIEPYRRSGNLSYAKMNDLARRRKVRLFVEDPAANLMVTSSGEEYSLYVNGKPDASSLSRDVPTQLLLAHVPLMLHPDPKDALVIGLASGVTSGTALAYPIERLDTVEIVRAMPRATSFFLPWNRDPFGDPRFHLIVDDARSYLSYTRQTYDVIISEPSNPWMAGTGSLFSVDFYERLPRTLRPGGIFLQWVQAYEMSDEVLLAIVRSLRRAFPHVYAFQAGAADLLLMASGSPVRPDPDRMRGRFEIPAIRESLAQIGIEGPEAFLFLQVLSPSGIDTLVALAGRENTDDNRFIEYRAPRDLFLGAMPTLTGRLDERLEASPALFWSRLVRARGRPDGWLETLAMLQDDRIQGPEGAVRGAYQVAAYHLAGSDLAALPHEVVKNWTTLPTTSPMNEADLAERIRVLANAGLARSAAKLAASYEPAILLEAALSPEKAGSWMDRARAWRAVSSGSGGGADVDLRRFLMNVEIAAGEVEPAASELLEWVRAADPPPADWAIRRACQIDDGELCDSVLEEYARRSPTLPIERLREIRRARVEGDRGGSNTRGERPPR